MCTPVPIYKLSIIRLYCYGLTAYAVLPCTLAHSVYLFRHRYTLDAPDILLRRGEGYLTIANNFKRLNGGMDLHHTWKPSAHG